MSRILASIQKEIGVSALSFILWLLLGPFLIGAPLLTYGDTSEKPFEQAIHPRKFQFPRDHGSHPEFATEWWYYTGHLQDEQKNRFGFQLTFFRVGLHRRPPTPSRWSANNLLIGHFAVTDHQGKRFLFSEKLARESGDAVRANTETLDVALGSWKTALADDGTISLHAEDTEKKLSLQMRPLKPPVLQGEGGLSIKGKNPGDASYYITLSRLAAAGTLTLAGKTGPVTGTVWMDHEFSSTEKMRDIVGWDWFAIQLHDGSEIMLYQLRDSNGVPTEFSSGTIIPGLGFGEPETLKASDFTLTPKRSWKSPASKISYPVEWEIKIPRRGISLRTRAHVEDQELRTEQSTGVNYWEGQTTVTGVKSQDCGPPLEITGDAYVEMVGRK